MSENRFVKLVERISAKTREGTLQWEETTKEGVFQTSFPGYSVRISVEQGYEGLDYNLSIYNDDGDLVDAVSDGALSELMSNAYQALASIYEGARRIARGVDEALTTILGELDED